MPDGELPRVQPSVEISQRVQPTDHRRDRPKKKRPERTKDAIEIGEDDEPTEENSQLNEADDDEGLDLRV